jgi:hypothetical protein
VWNGGVKIPVEAKKPPLHKKKRLW